MTPKERVNEVAAILARGILRLHKRNVRPNGQELAESRNERISENSQELP